METKLWYKQPAGLREWTKALPIGNGRMGAMVFGGINKERIQLNEESCWSGGYRDRHNPAAKGNLEAIRQHLKNGRADEAEILSRYALTAIPDSQRIYQTLGDMHIEFQDMPDNVTDYTRSLSLDDAIARVEFLAGPYRYSREVFASYPADAIIVRLTTDNPNGLSFDARVFRDGFSESSGILCENTVYFNGKNGGDDGISFHTVVQGSAKGGTVETLGEYVIFKNVSEATLFITAATSFRIKNHMEECLNILQKLNKKTYSQLREEHINDYQALESRVTLDISCPPSKLPTDERLANVQQGQPDAGLMALYFRYGRYLLIASSRPGTLPANLQGIWCHQFNPAWDSKYTININAEMNYWPAEICNLPECHKPLLDHIRRMHPHGLKTAETMYSARGFVAHHNTDLWGDTAPQDTWKGSTYWVMGAAWLCLHIWEHYEYSLDDDFLAAHFDLLKDACLFFVDFLIENSAGQLVVSPTISPENTYVLANGKTAAMCEGCAMDSQILTELFLAFEQASRVLKRDDDFAKKVAAMRAKLPPIKVGSNGGIMEWLTEQTEAEPGHRHMSHLFALFPGNGISPEETPQLAEAARKTLAMRLSHGGGHTGWSRAWIINFWARLASGSEAYYHLNALLNHSTHPNLFDDHPPFQIDGNFGATAAIANMLVQSTGDTIRLLKALPDEWPDGAVTGLCAKGGLTLDITWMKGELAKVIVTAKKDYNGRLFYKENVKELKLAAGEIVEFTGLR